MMPPTKALLSASKQFALGTYAVPSALTFTCPNRLRQVMLGSGTLGVQVMPPSRLCEHSSTSSCWQKYVTKGAIAFGGGVPAYGPMPTVGWSMATGHGALGVQAVGSLWGPPSVVVTDMTAQPPVSPPAMVVPVWWSVARMGSMLNFEYGEETLLQCPPLASVALGSKVTLYVLSPAWYSAAPVFQFTPIEGSPALSWSLRTKPSPGSPATTVCSRSAGAAELTKPGVP